MNIEIRPGVVQGVYELIEVLACRVKELEKALHQADLRRQGMSVKDEAESLLGVVFDGKDKAEYEHLVPAVIDWLLKHDGKILYSIEVSDE